jgi:hypothetical protein
MDSIRIELMKTRVQNQSCLTFSVFWKYAGSSVLLR